MTAIWSLWTLEGRAKGCSLCGYKDADSRDGKTFTCVECGVVLDADHNSAINILNLAEADGPSPPTP